MDDSSFKSSGGLRRIVNAARYSLAGLRAAIRHEAAFRQELAVGVPLVLLAPFIAPDRWAALAMIASILLVLIIELLKLPDTFMKKQRYHLLSVLVIIPTGIVNLLTV